MGHARNTLSRASFRRPPLSGQETFTVWSLHISNINGKKRGPAILIGQQIDAVAGDFNRTAGRCSNRDNISTIDEAFADSALPTFQHRPEPGGSRNPQMSAQLFRIDPGSLNGAGPGGVGNAQSSKASSICCLCCCHAGPGSIPNNWADVCGFLTPPVSGRYWKVRMHSAFSIPHKKSWSASKRSKLPSRDMAPPGFRRLTQLTITSRRT